MLSQTPTGGDSITLALSKIILYTEDSQEDYTTVPSLVGMTLTDALRTAVNSGLSIRLSGIEAISPNALDKITEQSLPPGEKVRRGSVIVIRAINTEHED